MATMSTRLNANHWLGQYGTRRHDNALLSECLGLCVFGGALMLLAGAVTGGR